MRNLNPVQITELLDFRRFRRHVIGFLRLPADVSEVALRRAIQQASPNLLMNYQQRVVKAHAILESARRVRSEIRESVAAV